MRPDCTQTCYAITLQGRKTNPIYLFFEEVDAPQSTSKDADSRDKHYKCYHGARKIITLKHSSRGNLSSEFTPDLVLNVVPHGRLTKALHNHIKTTFPLHYKLFELLRDRDSPPTQEEISYANATREFKGDLAQEFIKTLKKSQRTLDTFCQGKQVCIVLQALLSYR